MRPPSTHALTGLASTAVKGPITRVEGPKIAVRSTIGELDPGTGVLAVGSMPT